MAELNIILFFVSLVIFPARALDVILSGAHQDFKQKSEINIDIMDGEKIYRGTLNQLTFEAQNGTSKVIVYIISRSRCIEILRPAGRARAIRSQIARELREMHCELVFLGIEHFDDDEYHLIRAFIFDKIQPHPDRPDITIETIGENRFDQIYRCRAKNSEKYQENAQISLELLRSIPHGAVRPVESNDKEIRLWGYYPFDSEVRWAISVQNNEYVPNVSVSDPTYNFRMRHPDKDICLLILSGKEYSTVISHGKRRSQRRAMKSVLYKMEKNDEVLILLGVFNFDWTEIDIVTQIILKHSEGFQSSDYNVFTCGYGMFNTYYVYDYGGDRRCIGQQTNSHVSEVIKVLMGEETKKRVINVYYFDVEWQHSNIQINLVNGRYVPDFEFDHFILSSKLPFQKIAFIVYDQTEMNVPIDYSIVCQSAFELHSSGISVVLIEAINFGLDDMHIIAEWIDHHSGVTDLEQIAVLGGGIFETIFQSESTTYNTFLNTRKNLLEAIRNAYVKSGNGKSVFAAEIDDSKFQVWSYPMHSVVNGFYELDLIPDKNMFANTRKIYFIVTSEHNFKHFAAIKNLRSVMESFRANIRQHYPNWKWSIFLVGLDNFGKRDSHLFAELVRRQTNDGKSFRAVARAINYGIGEFIYQYRDTEPFVVEGFYSYMYERFAYSFGMLMHM